MELCEGGPLDEVLNDPEFILDHSTRLRIATETATGIAYLHLSDVSIVHGDMKAGNVLLTKDRCCGVPFRYSVAASEFHSKASSTW